MNSTDGRSIGEAVVETLEDILRPPLFGKPQGPIHLTDHLIRDLKMDGDDFSFLFVPTLEKRLGVKTTQEDWDTAYTVQDAVDVFTRHVHLKDRS